MDECERSELVIGPSGATGGVRWAAAVLIPEPLKEGLRLRILPVSLWMHRGLTVRDPYGVSLILLGITRIASTFEYARAAACG